MKVGEFINKLQNTLNKLIDKNDLCVKTTNLSNELLETLKIIENCTSCEKDKETNEIGLDRFLAELEKEEQGKNYKLNQIDLELNQKVLCEGCKEKKFEKLTDKYGNEEIVRFLYYQCKLNAKYYDNYIRWIPFDEFKNIKYLAKGGFGEVHKATWINGDGYHKDVVLKRIYNNSSDDKIVDILNEVK